MEVTRLVRRSLEGGHLSRIWQEVRFPPMGPNGWRMPKHLNFSSVLTHWHCAPCKPTAIFLKKMHFLSYILPFGCLIGYRQAHDLHRHSSCFTPPRIPVRHAGPPDFPHARAAGCHPQRCVHLQRPQQKPPKACRGIRHPLSKKALQS